MPPKRKTPSRPRPSGHTYPGRKAMSFTLSDETPARLKLLCERYAARLAELGHHANPDRLRSSVIDELVLRAWQAEQPDAGMPPST